MKATHIRKEHSKLFTQLMQISVMELVFLFLCSFLVPVTSSLREKRAERCSIENLVIQHGSYDVRSGSSIIAYTCDDGYILYGSEKLYCIASSWTTAPPKCITNTCSFIPVKDPLRVEKELNGSVLRFSCAVMNILEGAEVITCNGTSWSDVPPKCTPSAPATSCDFESPGICGWVHHDDTDVEWRSQMGRTKTSRTGPEHDHTLGAAGDGRYMYFETSSPTRTGHKAVLLSPLYPSHYSRRCFDFWYHVLAVGDVASLEVFIKPESKRIDDLSPVFSVSENKGDDWLKHTVPINYTAEPFQVVFVATRGKSFRSDLAIDDVSLYVCPDFFTTTSTLTSSTSSTATTKPSTQTTTYLPAATSMKTTTLVKRSTVSSPQQKFQSFSQSQTTNLSFSTTAAAMTTTMTPLINPNVPIQKSRVAAPDDGSSNLIYILVGVGLVAAVTVVVGVGIYCCRRKSSRDIMHSNGAVNPLYSAMASDEATISFVNAQYVE